MGTRQELHHFAMPQKITTHDTFNGNETLLSLDRLTTNNRIGGVHSCTSIPQSVRLEGVWQGIRGNGMPTLPRRRPIREPEPADTSNLKQSQPNGQGEGKEHLVPFRLFSVLQQKATYRVLCTICQSIGRCTYEVLVPGSSASRLNLGVRQERSIHRSIHSPFTVHSRSFHSPFAVVRALLRRSVARTPASCDTSNARTAPSADYHQVRSFEKINRTGLSGVFKQSTPYTEWSSAANYYQSFCKTLYGVGYMYPGHDTYCRLATMASWVVTVTRDRFAIQ
ncbi:hypothetical protein V8C37DRAFT_251479 [Trichoderma ceciliae]